MSPDNLTSHPFGWILALTSFVVLVVAILVFGKLNPKRPIIEGLKKGAYFSTDITFAYRPTSLFDMLRKYDRQVYFDAHRRFIKYDLIFALVYTAAAVIIILYLYGLFAPYVPAWFRHLWLLPLIGGACDILEGISMWGILDAYKDGPLVRLPTMLALFSSAMTTLKIIFLGATFVLLLLGGIALVGKNVWPLFKH
jgi:hypothetical protein